MGASEHRRWREPAPGGPPTIKELRIPAPGPELPLGTDFLLVIPRTIRKNTRIGTPLPGGHFTTSADHKRFRKLVANRVQKAGIPRLTFGVWGACIVSFWPRLRHLEDRSVPYGDVDAPGTAVLDALASPEGAHLFDDDVRVAPLLLDRQHDPANPRIEVLLWRHE